jgi:hypothetical protein
MHQNIIKTCMHHLMEQMQPMSATRFFGSCCWQNGSRVPSCRGHFAHKRLHKQHPSVLTCTRCCGRYWLLLLLLLLLLLQPVEVEAAVRGKLPAWLCGSLVVNGGGDYSHMSHMFDGYGLLAKVRLQGGRAWGAQRYVDSKVYRAYKREGEQQQQQQ